MGLNGDTIRVVPTAGSVKVNADNWVPVGLDIFVRSASGASNPRVEIIDDGCNAVLSVIVDWTDENFPDDIALGDPGPGLAWFLIQVATSIGGDTGGCDVTIHTSSGDTSPMEVNFSYKVDPGL